MMLNTFFNDFGYDDGYSFSPYGSRYYPSRRAAELERYYRLKEDEEKRRQKQAFLRMLRQKQEEEEEYQRLVGETARLRRMQQEKTRRVPPEAYDDEFDEPDYQLVRAPDGRLYRIPSRLSRKMTNTSKANDGHCLSEHQADGDFDFDEPKHKIVRGADGRVYRVVSNPTQPNRMETSKGMATPSRSEKLEFAPMKQQSAVFAERGKGLEIPIVESVSNLVPKEERSKKPKKRVTVIVEDASDSETEDEYHSVWRNRRPSPGEWMEPVEGF